ncbi:hypothetical protein PoB_001534400 [Plakobranchus ocellatus]|uniref:Uncharacterized protein n=1 Tax=Plakobranchus ocellatus TaxID=259542 RepID=A0AAV3Z4B7_9GAST|nr:hypothetical protein PoB_001534400 [Plakobranchus ocellatus]
MFMVGFQSGPVGIYNIVCFDGSHAYCEHPPQIPTKDSLAFDLDSKDLCRKSSPRLDLYRATGGSTASQI